MREFTVYTREDFGGIHSLQVFGERFIVEERGGRGHSCHDEDYEYVDFRVDGTLIRAFSVVSITEKVEDAEVDIFRLDKPVPKKKVSDRIIAYNTWKARDEVESEEAEKRAMWNTATRIRGF